MSNLVSGYVKRRTVGSPVLKSVLMYMADCASDDGTGIWTSKGNLSADLELGIRTVQRSILELIKLGLISEAGQKKCKNGYTIDYQINLPEIGKLASTRTPVTVTPLSEGHPYPRHSDTPTPVTVTPKPSLEPSIEPSLTIRDAGASDPPSLSPKQIVANCIDIYNTKAKEIGWPQCQKVTSSRRASLLARVKDAGGVDGWRAAVNKAAVSPWCLGGNDRGWTADIDFLLRESKFTRLMEGSYDDRTAQHNGPINSADGMGKQGDQLRGSASEKLSYAREFARGN